jgi:hypothetical protein
MPETWQRIMDYMRQCNGPVRPIEVEEALGLENTPRHVMNRMVLTGVLRRVETGVYVIKGTS